MFFIFFIFTFSYSIPIKEIHENVYSFSGMQSYNSVLSSLAYSTKRSVLGSTDILMSTRYWKITDKKFSDVISHVKKNADVDGYVLEVSSKYFLIYRKDTSDNKVIVQNDDTLYYYTSPYTGITQSTSDFAEYKNFHILDSIQYYSNLNKQKFQKIVVDIIGFTDNFVRSNGIKFDGQLFGVTFNDIVLPNNTNSIATLNLPEFLLELKNTDSRYNFYRRMVFYMPLDTSLTFRFASEERREQGVTQSNGIVTTKYESVFNGLTITIKDSVYSALYRLKDTDLSLMGLLGYQTEASAQITQETRSKLFPHSKRKLHKNKVYTNFHIYLNIEGFEVSRDSS